jgi:hypothetical protein
VQVRRQCGQRDRCGDRNPPIQCDAEFGTFVEPIRGRTTVFRFCRCPLSSTKQKRSGAPSIAHLRWVGCKTSTHRLAVEVAVGRFPPLSSTFCHSERSEEPPYFAFAVACFPQPNPNTPSSRPEAAHLAAVVERPPHFAFAPSPPPTAAPSTSYPAPRTSPKILDTPSTIEAGDNTKIKLPPGPAQAC